MIAVAPEVSQSGCGFSIFDGYSSPRTEDDSKLGTTSASAGFMHRAFVIANAGPYSLSVIDVSVDTPLFNLTILPLSLVFIHEVVLQKLNRAIGLICNYEMRG